MLVALYETVVMLLPVAVCAAVKQLSMQEGSSTYKDLE